MNWETLLCFGDSITYGARSYVGYPEVCGSILSDRLNKEWNIINHSFNGYTTMDLVRSIDSKWSNLANIYPSLITVMIGTNDIKNRVSPQNFRMAYAALLVKLKLLSVNKNIVLLKIPRLARNVFYPYNFSMNETIDGLNKEIEALASLHGMRLFAFELDDADFFDGVHLSETGVQHCGTQLAEFILKDKGH